MYVVGDIAYSDNFENTEKKISEIKIISELCMLVIFTSGEKRIFDAKYLIQYPAYKKLEDFEIFKKAYIEKGIIIWNNGEIDIAPETVYQNSYPYEETEVI